MTLSKSFVQFPEFPIIPHVPLDNESRFMESNQFSVISKCLDRGLQRLREHQQSAVKSIWREARVEWSENWESDK
jgi:hypothetical protein